MDSTRASRLANLVVLMTLLVASCKKDAPESGAPDESATPAKAKAAPAKADVALSDDERLGRLAVEAIKSGDLGPLLKIPPGMSAVLRDEIAKTQELTSQDFPGVLRDMDDAGIDRSSIDFVRIEDSGLSNAQLGSGDLIFRTVDGTEYRMLLNWSRSKSGTAVLGLSRWFKKATE